MTKEEKIELIAKTLEMHDADSLTPERLLSSIEEFDSFGMILIISMLGKHFKQTVTKEEIEAFACVQDIMDRMEQRCAN